MTREELQQLLHKYGDAVVTYKSENSNKLKYNVCTTDFNNDYIKTKPNRAKDGGSSVLMFCWDCDSFRLMNAERVKSVVPLSAILKNE